MAKRNYEVQRAKTERIIQECLDQVKDTWENYYDGAITILTFAKDPTKAECLDHEYWIDGIEVLLTQLQLASKPPADIALSQAQLLLRIDTNMEAMERILRERLDEAETSLNDATTPVTGERLETIQKILVEVMDAVRELMSELYDQRVEKAPPQVQATTRTKREFLNTMRVHSLRQKI